MPQAPEPAAIQATTQTDEPQPPALFFPESVNHYALLSVQAASTKGAAGGYRLWILAKTLDQKGEGNVKRDDLRAYTDYLGVTVRTWQRWVNEARTMGFVQDIQTDPSKGGKWLFVLASYQRAAAALFEQSVINQRESIEKIQQSAISDQQKQARLKRVRACNVASMGTRKATIPAVDFVGDGWRARVWASYEKLFREKPITRAKLQQLTQIPARTQYHHEKTAGVKVVHSYAKTTYTKDQAHGLREHSNHKGLFVGFNGDVLFALPNVYRYEPATIGARGRARKVNKKLSALLGQEGLSHRRRALTSNNELDQATDKFLYRLFNVTDKQFKATRKKIRDQKPTGGDVYAYPKGARSGALMWEHAHACDYLPRVEA